MVTIAAAPRAKADGYVFVGASNPESGPFRARARGGILKQAQDGELVVPMAQTFAFDDAPAAFTMLTSPHAPGKLALVNDGPVTGMLRAARNRHADQPKSALAVRNISEAP